MSPAQISVVSLTDQQNDQPNLSLLSLSIAAATAAPIAASSAAESTTRPSQVTGHNGTTKHRRLSSAGRSRRRLSDARDAATRPSPASLQTASALASLATLSLTSPTVSHAAIPQSLNGAQQPLPILAPANSTIGTLEPSSMDDKEFPNSLPTATGVLSAGASITKSGKKRGTIFTCESCSKVYRHPSCLIKHRWEHTPQWREASKFVLSKHQQVQLLEAAAILSHLSPSSASLPEDRSLWPSFLSGGVVPPPAPGDVAAPEAAPSPSSIPLTHPVSSSVPATSVLGSGRAGSTGPRLHDYSVPPPTSGAGGITQLRPGLLGVPTVSPSGISSSPSGDSRSSPLPVPAATATATDDDALNLLSLRSASVKSESWGSPISASYYEVSSFSSSKYQPYAPSEIGWSLPRSSVRSKSTSSHSRSASESKSDDEGELVDVDDNTIHNPVVYGLNSRGRVSGTRFTWKTEDDDGVIGFSVREEDEEEDGKVSKAADQEWDGMEMDMEMD
ncbi:hypothetical protein HYDPIDRAFT_175740 [Hydnomerulius pinastri MD-312]|uniref:C2H2-type domain-containing protein n=1 Tax=Hydnomerulius pinastri MD-312 TaxID=994086 RepID=A0A0C9WF85_9AGAM|nr:hypothetical protein HYDPIDRAFT_175740 [Hydnomerulius pinastri MD-312]